MAGFFYSRRFLVLILLCLTGAISFIGYQTYRQQLARAESAMQEQIKLIGDLKALEISQWLKERQGDAKTLSHNFALTAGLQDFLADPGSSVKYQLVLTWLKTLRDGYDYAAVALVDSQGRVLLSVPETKQTLGPQTQALVQQALTRGDVVFSDLSRVSDESAALGPPLRLDFVAPLQSRSQLNNDLFVALLLRVDPRDFLFPLLQLWPIPSTTAEALLVRQEGNKLTFLSPLRHHPVDPLSLTLPLTTPKLIAAQSFLQGGAKEVKGVDYRGEPVLASFRPILDSPWHLVAKVDQREVNQWVQQHTDSILPQVILGLLVTGSVIGLLWRRQSRILLKAKAVELEKQVQDRTADLMAEIKRRKASEEALRQERNRAQQYLDIVQVVIVVLDPQGRVLLLNQTGCEQLGYSEMDLLDRNWFETVIPESDRTGTLEEFQRLLQQRPGTTHSFENRVHTRDGQERLYIWHHKIMTTSAGTLVGTISAGKDITEPRRLMERLRATTERLQALLDASPLVIMELDPEGRVTYWNQAAERLLGWRAEETVGQLLPYVPTDKQNETRQLQKRVLQGETLQGIEAQRQKKDGTFIDVRISAAPIHDNHGDISGLVAIVEDITEHKRTENALQESETRYRSLFENNHAVMLLIDPGDGAIVDANPAACGYYGWTREVLTQKYIHEINTLKPAQIRREMEQAHLQKRHYFLFQHRRADGAVRDVEVYSGPISLKEKTLLYSIIHDVSERRQAEERLRLSAAVIQSTRDGVVVTDLTPRIIFVNPAFMEITGYTEAELFGQNPSMLQSGRQDRAFYRELWTSLLQTGYWEGEMWNRRKDGEIYPQWLSISTVRNESNKPIHYVGISTDITQLKQNQAQLERLAHYDVLTKLPNRLLAMARLAHVCERAKRHTFQFAVLYLDLDRFKTVNDSLGHSVGDELLVAVARRLRHRLRAEDTLARLGGDEFLVLLEEIAHPKDAEIVAQEIIVQLTQPFYLADKQQIYVSVSIGISVFPDDAGGVDEMVRNADAAMYLAKSQGRNTYRFYTEALTQAAKARLELESRLRHGLERDEFIVYYQPLMSLLENRLVGAEALVRWQPSGQAPIPPGHFIPIAEETGLIVPLGEWVLRTAVAQAKTWMEAGLPDLTMAVNVSVQQLRRQDFPQRVSDVLMDSGLPAVHLELELTESGLMEQSEWALTILQALKALGVKLAIDDFGTGYSSLAYLKRFPIDKLKIDREFIRDTPEDANDAEIAATVIAMGRHLHLEVLAEGIETEEQLAFLREQNCSLGQGYLFSAPVTADEFIRYATVWKTPSNSFSQG